MGLIRKSLAVGTLGVVRPNSKKQRVAKGQLKEMRKQTQLLEQHARAERAAQRVAAQAPAPQVAPAPMQPPAAGWYPDADRPHMLRWWDGQNWTEQLAPRG
ncbi:DUF2510 domain-containing protein [Pseudonocardia ailaonensis]|uniref:DUF2510 domain-containing protein n=1 Tax=Pseudonocardia ailaonensis TaxID=367279 RepID=A0ABN2NE19_9PSEU